MSDITFRCTACNKPVPPKQRYELFCFHPHKGLGLPSEVKCRPLADEHLKEFHIAIQNARSLNRRPVSSGPLLASRVPVKNLPLLPCPSCGSVGTIVAETQVKPEVDDVQHQ